jgi:hypothetical protein
VIESYSERWDLTKSRYRVAILRDGNALEWCETTSDGVTTGRGETLHVTSVPSAIHDLIGTLRAEGYHLGGHEQYDPRQLAAYLAQLEQPDPTSEQQPGGAFWSDLNRDLGNPEFAAAYEQATQEIRAADADHSDVTAEAGPQRSDGADVLRRFLAHEYEQEGATDDTPVFDAAGYELTYGHLREVLRERDAVGDDATEKVADRLMADLKLRSMEIRNGTMDMDLTDARELCAMFVSAARAMLGDAPNYTETPIGFPKAHVDFEVKIAESPDDWYVLTVQRKWGMTPHEARLKAEAERDQLQRQLEAAEAQPTEVAQLYKLLADLVPLDDDATDACWFDHHGGCQAHGYLSLELGEKCPVAEARELLAARHTVKPTAKFDLPALVEPTPPPPDPHRVTVHTIRVLGPNREDDWTDEVSYDIEHTPHCDALPYMQNCWIDHQQYEAGTDDWPTERGVYIATGEAVKYFNGEVTEYDFVIDFEPEPNPLETVVAEAAADIAATPADHDPEPAPPATPWLIEAGDD